ncbi:MerR family DNA-binding transcriptional regulator, partial [Streptomyces sp. NPDC004596]
MKDHWTVGRVAEPAGVSVRTLHHYDQIRLVRPPARTTAGYQAHAPADTERPRQTLTHRRLEFGLREAADLADDPSTNAVAHLRRLRGLLLRPCPTWQLVVALDMGSGRWGWIVPDGLWELA